MIYRLISFTLCSLLINHSVSAAPAVALGYTPKYSPGFTHFDYADPKARKGGNLILSGFGSFDSLNPFLLKGSPADGLNMLAFETLMVQSQDEPYSLYAHLAEDIQLAQDRLSVTFRLDPRARFSDGSPVLASDVKYSFDTLKSDKANPQYRFYWADIRRATVLAPRKIRFDFVRVNPEIHLLTAQIPVFARKWVGIESFDKLSRRKPIGSGPYTIESYHLGKDITYVRNPNYWARDLNTRRGMFNFDQIIYKYYKDETVQLEALKAGEYDFRLENYSKQWAKGYVGPQFDNGLIKKESLPHKNIAGMQGFFFNTRRDLFKDKRVRKALALAFDFDWSNKNLFYGQYTRCDSYFSNSDLAATGLPSGDELRLLNKYRKQIDPDVFTEIWQPAQTDQPDSVRRNLRQAKALLAAAGWRIRDGVLKNDKGQVFEFEVMLAQKGFERILAPYAHHLQKLGITIRYRTVDVSLYIRRMRTFDFDVMVSSYSQSQSPGNELYNYWHSRSAKQEGSRNLVGIHDPVVDALIDEVVFSPDRKRLVTAVHALDRVLLHGEYAVPNWYINVHRVAYWDKFDRPKTLPLYYEADSWAVSNWWRKAK